MTVKKILFTVFLLSGSAAMGQTSTFQKPNPVAEQKLDGTAEVFLHLGGKLVDELKNKLNIESDDLKKSTEKVKVVYDFGLFKLEREETRAVKKP